MTVCQVNCANYPSFCVYPPERTYFYALAVTPLLAQVHFTRIRNGMRPFILALLFLPVFSRAQAGKDVVFEANKNQWPSQVNFMADIDGGRVFLGKSGFTFVMQSNADLEKAHENSHGSDINHAVIHAHAYRVDFAGANENPVIAGQNLRPA